MKKTKKKERARRKRECVPFSDHWGVLAEFKFNSGYDDKPEKLSDIKIRTDPEKDKKEIEMEEKANLALKEGIDILMDGIAEGQDRRLHHIILGLISFSCGLIFLWVEPFNFLGRWWWFVSRLIITLIIPIATGELILGFLSVSDEILCLRQVAMEMDLTRQMDPHWRLSHSTPTVPYSPSAQDPLDE